MVSEGYHTTVNVSNPILEYGRISLHISHTYTSFQVFLRTFNVPVDQVVFVHVVHPLQCRPQDLSTSLPYQVCPFRELTVGHPVLLQLQDVVMDATSHLPDGGRQVLCNQGRKAKELQRRTEVLE